MVSDHPVAALHLPDDTVLTSNSLPRLATPMFDKFCRTPLADYLTGSVHTLSLSRELPIPALGAKLNALNRDILHVRSSGVVRGINPDTILQTDTGQIRPLERVALFGFFL